MRHRAVWLLPSVLATLSGCTTPIYTTYPKMIQSPNNSGDLMCHVPASTPTPNDFYIMPYVTKVESSIFVNIDKQLPPASPNKTNLNPRHSL
jgi:hypothetical protein